MVILMQRERVCVCMCVRVCVRARVLVCVRVCVCVCIQVGIWMFFLFFSFFLCVYTGGNMDVRGDSRADAERHARPGNGPQSDLSPGMHLSPAPVSPISPIHTHTQKLRHTHSYSLSLSLSLSLSHTHTHTHRYHGYLFSYIAIHQLWFHPWVVFVCVCVYISVISAIPPTSQFINFGSTPG